MSKSTQRNTEGNTRNLLDKIGSFLNNPIIAGVIAGIVILSIEYRSGFFQVLQNNSNQSIPLIWSGVAAFITVALCISFKNYVRISLNSQNHFREEFSFVILTTVTWLVSALVVSLMGQLMFWHPLIAIFHILSDRELALSRPSWGEYAFLTVLIILFYLFASIRHQNWDGLKSVQQHQREQRSEVIGVFSEGLREVKRILNHEADLERYSEIDPTQLLGHLEQSEDLISQAWEEQARELLRLSSSSYDIDLKSGWHDRQGCWVGRNIDTGDLFFLYPAQTALSRLDLEAFVRYSQGISKSQDCKISELIIAFRENRDKLATPTDSYKNIRFETEQNLLEKLVNFTDYINDIRKRVLFHKLPESDLALHNVYVPSQLTVSQEKRADDNIEDYLQNWLNEPSQRQIALLGEYGQGKSSAALMFTYRLLCEGRQLPARIPILIELRGKSPRDLGPLELLGAWASQYRIEPQALMRLHIAGRLVLIFEGFDEMALIGSPELRLRHFRSLWKFCYPNTKIIITGRPNFFLDDREMKTALGIIKPISDKPYCEAIRLLPFTVDQIREALREQKQLVREQICSLAQTEARFLELVSRPSLLHVVSILWERERLYEKTALLSSAYVMECFVRSSYRRQGLKAQGSREFMALNSSERDYFMCGTASYMAAEQLSNQISSEQLNDLIDALTQAIPISVSTSTPEIFGEDTRPLKVRIQDPQNDLEHIRTDVRTCGLLVDDPSTPGTFKFGHKSFMEYLFAVTVKEYIWDVKSEKAKAVKKVTNFPIEIILDLPVSVSFLAEMIGTDTSTKQLSSQVNVELKGERATSTRLLKVIFGAKDNLASWLLLRFVLFSFSYLASGKKFKATQRNLILFTNPLIIAIVFLFLTSYFLFLLAGVKIGDFEKSYSFTLLAALLSSLLNGTYIFSLFELKSSNQQSLLRKFRLWNSICKELQINDIVLHQIAGTWLLPWAREQPFDYFLDKSKLDKSNAS